MRKQQWIENYTEKKSEIWSYLGCDTVVERVLPNIHDPTKHQHRILEEFSIPAVKTEILPDEKLSIWKTEILIYINLFSANVPNGCPFADCFRTNCSTWTGCWTMTFATTPRGTSVTLSSTTQQGSHQTLYSESWPSH